MIVQRALSHVSPDLRVRIAGWLLIVSCLAWPVTSLTVFSSGGATAQGILGLSWLALILTCVDIVVTTDVRAEQDTDTAEIVKCIHCGKPANA